MMMCDIHACPPCAFAEHLLLLSQCHHGAKDNGIPLLDAVASEHAKQALKATEFQALDGNYSQLFPLCHSVLVHKTAIALSLKGRCGN